MPAVYAHYRFGAAMLNTMPADIRRTAKRYRRLYDVGLHGPDLFFYYNPLRHRKFGTLGSRIHHQPGKDFFGRACRSLRLEPSEGAEAYLYGVLCHYALDAACHPFIWEQDRLGLGEHIEMETEFDRYLLETDGKIPPENQSMSQHLLLNAAECEVAARFYPEVTGKVIDRSVRHMKLANKVMAVRGKTARNLLQNGLGLADWSYRGFIMTEKPNPNCCQFNKPIMELYKKAEEKFPGLLMQLSAHLTYNAPLGTDFSATFG